jgi:hypothetical protein
MQQGVVEQKEFAIFSATSQKVDALRSMAQEPLKLAEASHEQTIRKRQKKGARNRIRLA